MSFLSKRRKASQDAGGVSSKGLNRFGWKVNKPRVEIPLPPPEPEPTQAGDLIVPPEKPKPDLEADLTTCVGFMSRLSKEDLRDTQKLLKLEGYFPQILGQIRPLLNDERPINH